MALLIRLIFDIGIHGIVERFDIQQTSHSKNVKGVFPFIGILKYHPCIELSKYLRSISAYQGSWFEIVERLFQVIYTLSMLVMTKSKEEASKNRKKINNHN